jgi:hypothetical protein
VFHVEIRAFPHVARGFNMTAERLHSQILARWARDEIVDFEDRRWSPERAKLTIYEGPQLRPDEIGLGRGWGNVTRQSKDVTVSVLAAARASATTGHGAGAALGAAGAGAGTGAEAAAQQPPGLAELKQRLLEELGGGQVALSRVPGLAAERLLGVRASQRLALAEQAVWELLHEGHAGLIDAGGAVTRERWEPIVLSWESWAADPGSIFLAGSK